MTCTLNLVCALQGPCDNTDAYWSYEGVVRAMTEGDCDVGFTNNTVFTNYTAGGTQAQAWSTRPASDFRILCRSGGCAEVDQFSECSNARVSTLIPPSSPPCPPLPPPPSAAGLLCLLGLQRTEWEFLHAASLLSFLWNAAVHQLACPFLRPLSKALGLQGLALRLSGMWHTVTW